MRTPVRPIVLFLAATLVAVGLSVGACLRGDRLPRAIVVGSSMAETLLARHLVVICDDCRIPIRCATGPLSSGRILTCPNCGYAQNKIDLDQAVAGDRVRIETEAYARQLPCRWEMVVCRRPDGTANHDLSVKRIVAMPGERVGICDGDILIDGRIVSKSLDQLRAMAVLVYDHQYRPSRTVQPARWMASAPDSHWSGVGGGFDYPLSDESDGSSAVSSAERDWLVYHHVDCAPEAPRRADPSHIDDYLPFNQGFGARRHYVNDLLLACRVSANGSGKLLLRIHNGSESFQAGLCPESGLVELFSAEGKRLNAGNHNFGSGDRFAVEFTLCDQRALVGIDGAEVLTYAYQRSCGVDFRPTPNPLAIAALGLDVHIDELKVFRDVHYLNPGGANNPWSPGGPLDSDEFFVLGDNPALSTDSRFWSGEVSIRRKSILGKVLSQFPP